MSNMQVNPHPSSEIQQNSQILSHPQVNPINPPLNPPQIRPEGSNRLQHTQLRLSQMRRKLLQSMPNDTCAYISAFDLLRGANWLSLATIWMNDQPDIIKALLKQTIDNSQLSKCLPVLQQAHQGYFQQDLQTTEDPWIIVQLVRFILGQYIHQHQHIPILKTENCPQNCQGFQGDLTYSRPNPISQFSIENSTCCSCSNSGKTQIKHLPQQFYIRLSNTRQGAFDEFKIPTFPTHKAKSYMQYNKALNHFRTIQYNYRGITIRDGFEQSVQPHDKISQILSENQWSTYIILFRSESEPTPKQNCARRLAPSRKITGSMFRNENQPNNPQCQKNTEQIRSTRPSFMERATEIAQMIHKTCKQAYNATMREDILSCDLTIPTQTIPSQQNCQPSFTVRSTQLTYKMIMNEEIFQEQINPTQGNRPSQQEEKLKLSVDQILEFNPKLTDKFQDLKNGSKKMRQAQRHSIEPNRTASNKKGSGKSPHHSFKRYKNVLKKSQLNGKRPPDTSDKRKYLSNQLYNSSDIQRNFQKDSVHIISCSQTSIRIRGDLKAYLNNSQVLKEPRFRAMISQQMAITQGLQEVFKGPCSIIRENCSRVVFENIDTIQRRKVHSSKKRKYQPQTIKPTLT